MTLLINNAFGAEIAAAGHTTGLLKTGAQTLL